MGLVLFDFRDALRGLRRDRACTFTVVSTLALTIGATMPSSQSPTVLLKLLAYRESHRLVAAKESGARSRTGARRSK
jgi:hypothetical protein